MTNTANVVLFEEINKVGIGTARLKVCASDEIVTETIYSAISPGTELRTLAGHYGAADKFPFIPGYSSVGRVIAVGDKASGWRVGDLVSSRNPVPFEATNSMWGGQASHQVITTVGEDRPVLLPDDANPLDYVMAEVASIGLRGAEAAVPKPGETAVVIGQGVIGAFSAAWLGVHGCRVIVVDLEASRLERALRNGAAYAVSPKEPDTLDRILTICNGGADIVVEASGSIPGVEMAFKLLRKKPQNYAKEYKVEPIRFYGGDWPRLVFQANYLEPISWKPDTCLPGEAALLITPRDRGIEERQRVVEHIRAGRLIPRNFVDQIFPWQDAPSAYAGLLERRIFSAVIDWKGNN
ncbi:MAG: zinc-binding alcohol dehydrogenase [Chthoniobacterales bacterium]